MTLFTLYHLQILTNQHQTWSECIWSKISGDFDYGSNPIKTVWLICPWIRKFAIIDFVNTLASANFDQSVPNWATIYMAIRFWMSLIMGQIEPEHPELFALEFEKIAEYDFVYTLSSTNIDQSAPNLVKMYVIIRSRMSLIMDLIILELFELSALKLENLPYLTLASANIYQSVPNLATIYLPIRSRMSSIMEQIKPENLELFALEFEKIAETDFVYTLAYPNINQSAPNLVKMYVTIRSWMNLIMNLIGADLSWVICPWICKKCWIWLCLHSSIYKCRQMSTKHGHNIYDNEILDEFNYGSNSTVSSRVICPLTRKNCLIRLCLHSSIFKL